MDPKRNDGSVAQIGQNRMEVLPHPIESTNLAKHKYGR